MVASASRPLLRLMLLAMAISLPGCTYATIPGAYNQTTVPFASSSPKGRQKVRFMVLIQGIPCLKNGYGIPVGSRFRPDYVTEESMRGNFCYDQAPLGWYPIDLYFTHPLSGLYSLQRSDIRQLPLRLDAVVSPDRTDRLEYVAPLDYDAFRAIYDHPKNLLVVRIRNIENHSHWSRYLSVATIGILPGYTTMSYRTTVVYYDSSGTPHRLSGEDPVLKRWSGVAFLLWGQRLSRTPEELIAARVAQACEILSCDNNNVEKK